MQEPELDDVVKVDVNDMDVSITDEVIVEDIELRSEERRVGKEC